MTMTRRKFIQATVVTELAAKRATAGPVKREKSPSIILAPSNLGLRPPKAGHQPGAWRAPQVWMAAGSKSAVGAIEVLPLERPSYDFEAQPGTRIRNGQSIRTFSLQFAGAVCEVLERDKFPLVIGGDGSILLGGLYGLRQSRGRGLVHVDGHSDFYQLNARDPAIGSAAGMDFALVSGRGEALPTSRPNVGTPLTRDEDIAQIGEREPANDRDRIPGTAITQITAQRFAAEGACKVAMTAIEILKAQRSIERGCTSISMCWIEQNAGCRFTGRSRTRLRATRRSGSCAVRLRTHRWRRLRHL